VARTSLLHSFQRLAAEHRAADILGTSPAEVRAREADARANDDAATADGSPRISRRAFLGSSAVAGTALALGGPAIIARGATPRIAIVGGGIAGLSCALALADKGVDATIYESSTRVGGRMQTDSAATRGGASYWADGQSSEWGGELIDTGHKAVQALAQRFKLPLDDLLGAEPNGSEDTYYFFGSYYTKTQADIDFRPVHQALQADVWAASYPTTFEINTPGGIELDNTSIHDWIESRVPGGHASPLGRLLDVAYDIEFGAPTTDQSSLNLVYLLGYNASPGNFALFGGSDERYRIRGGNQQLPEKMAAYLDKRRAGSIQRGMRMTSIARTRSASTYTLTFDTASGAQTVVADQVVLALPFAVLRDLDYRRAGFDDLKGVAIEGQGTGHNGKLQLQFNRRLWNEAGPWPAISNGAAYADTGFQNTWDVSRAQAGTSGILVDYTGGRVTDSIAATQARSDASSNTQVVTAARKFLAQIEPVYPGLSKLWNTRATLSLPHLDPNFNCSYSYWRVGQCSTIAGYEGRRQGNVHFAGEHTSVDFQGWIEGGATSGQRAASEVLADLK
jgi:monoamine oxidase